MKILLTGASSYVGARLYFDLHKSFDIVGTYNNSPLSDKFIKLDITSFAAVEKCVTEYKPDVIIHAAANANARWCEANPDLAYSLNEKATESLVNAANTIQAKIIFISSFAAINPTTVYGKTKQISEHHIKQTKNGHVILRPSLIIGFSPNTTNDRPFNRILKNLDKKIPAVYDTSWKFQPTYAGHISEVIKQVIEKDITNQTIAIAVPEVKSRFDIAKDILQTFGIPVTPEDKHDTTPVHIEDFQQLAKLKLQQYSYQEIIEQIITEIKHRDRFTLK
jgi:dTDP-4-dehydrorhamnose reductase